MYISSYNLNIIYIWYTTSLRIAFESFQHFLYLLFFFFEFSLTYDLLYHGHNKYTYWWLYDCICWCFIYNMIGAYLENNILRYYMIAYINDLNVEDKLIKLVMFYTMLIIIGNLIHFYILSLCVGWMNVNSQYVTHYRLKDIFNLY